MYIFFLLILLFFVMNADECCDIAYINILINRKRKYHKYYRDYSSFLHMKTESRQLTHEFSEISPPPPPRPFSRVHTRGVAHDEEVRTLM